MNTLTMYIGDTEVVCDKEFTISEEMLTTSSTILNNCYPKSWETTHDYVTNFYFPKDYSLCKILKNNTLKFAGVVKNTGNISLNPREPHYSSLQILDFKTLLSEGETLDFVISDKTIEEAIEMVIDAVNDYGFVKGNIEILNPDDVIGAYSTLDKTPYDVFQYLAEISQSKWTTRLVSENSVAIDFYDPTLMEEAEDLEYDTEYFEDNNIIDISYSYSTGDYRNKQTILSDEVYADIDYTETIIADGYATTFHTSTNIGKVTTITVDDVPKTIVDQTQYELGVECDFYYKISTTDIIALDTYSAGAEIEVTYTALIQGRQVVLNSDEITRIENQINRKGIISRYENRNDVVSSAELRKIGQTYIKYKGMAEIELTVNTYDNDLYNVCETVTMTDCPISDLNTQYMVKSKETKIINTTDQEHIFYTYILTNSFNSERAINYFDNQRNKTTGNISAGEFITRNIDIEDTANIIFQNLVITQAGVVGDNILNSTLESPFNN